MGKHRRVPGCARVTCSGQAPPGAGPSLPALGQVPVVLESSGVGEVVLGGACGTGVQPSESK